jgi:hypothetical protein
VGWPPGAGWPLTISFTRARPRTGGLCESSTCPGTKRDGRSTKKPVSESCYSCTQSRVLGQNLGPSRPQLDDPGPEGRLCPPLPGTSRSSVSRRGASPGLSPSNPGRIVVVPSQAPCLESRVPVEGRVIRRGEIASIFISPHRNWIQTVNPQTSICTMHTQPAANRDWKNLRSQTES